MRTGVIAWTTVAGLTLCSTGSLYAQSYPAKAIRLVATEVGSGTDSVARILAVGLSTRLNQPVVVENRGGNVSAEIVARGTADGYTLLAAGSSFWVGTLFRK